MTLFIEAGVAPPPVDEHGLVAGDLVVTQHGEEVQVAQVPSACLGEPVTCLLEPGRSAEHRRC